jgi:signal transduction histidine kinase
VARAVVGLLVVTAVLVYAFADNETLAIGCQLVVALGASVGAWIGAERAPRGRRLVPRLIAVGVTLSTLGHVSLGVVDSLGGETDVSIADVPFAASYLAFGAAIWIVLRRSRARSDARVDVDFLIDGLTIVVVTVLIIWSISVDAIAADDSVSPFTRMVWAVYPLASSLVFALAVRALMSRGARAAMGPSLAMAAGLVLAANLIYLQAPGDGPVLVMMNIAWMVAPVLAARAAWRHDEVRADASLSPALDGWTLVVAIGPLFVPPALLLIAILFGAPDNQVQVFIGTMAVALLAFIRTARLIRSEARTRRELEVARDAALDASRAKSMILANMSHEIRTPLTTVLAASEILEDTPLDEQQLGLLTKMHRSGDRLKALVEGILDFSRIEAGELDLASTRFDLHALVADAAEPCTLRALEADIGFSWELDPDVPRHVLGDPNRLFQVLTNVLDNALKFTHEGQVSLAVRLMPAHEAGAAEVVEFVVDDTGIGILEQDQESVFESFRQVDGSMTRRYGGNGLGLAICAELTELMGGTITLQSRLGAGSTFVIRVPLTSIIQATPAAKEAPLVA